MRPTVETGGVRSLQSYFPAESSQLSLSQKYICRQVRCATKSGCKMTGEEWSLLSPRFTRRDKASDHKWMVEGG